MAEDNSMNAMQVTHQSHYTFQPLNKIQHFCFRFENLQPIVISNVKSVMEKVRFLMQACLWVIEKKIQMEKPQT